MKRWLRLLQLNRHLDDTHKNLEEVKQDEVKDWFKTQMIKAKKFQPLAFLNQKLKGLDVFDSNDALPAPPPSSDLPSAIPNDICPEPLCGKRLGSANGKVNFRKCGKLFCEDHTMYQMKLSRSAQHEPVRGFWCRCCETCYKSREGYNDHNGLERDDTPDFIDALDENDNEQFPRRKVAKFLIRLAGDQDDQGHGVFKVCAASRPENDLSEMLSTYVGIKIQDWTKSDMKIYVNSTLGRHPPMQGFLQSEAKAKRKQARNFMKSVVDKAEGVFLWIRLVVDDLCDALTTGLALTLTDLKKRLEGIPSKERYEFFRHILGKIPVTARVEAEIRGPTPQSFAPTPLIS
ncbi:carboxypeptidase Y-deficient [Trapelia coarctata]|nr:carboxypeptidase Y-deficient [Trapelia coarctata]